MTADTAHEDRNTTLDPATCRQLLGSGRVGRVAFNDDPSPTVLPVNYAMHEGAVVFRTAEGRKLTAAADGAHASFEVDGVDAERDSGWSVLVRGRLEEIDEPSGDLARTASRIVPLVGGTRPYLVRLTIEEITGRRIAPDPEWVRAHREGNTWSDQDGSDLLG